MTGLPELPCLCSFGSMSNISGVGEVEINVYVFFLKLVQKGFDVFEFKGKCWHEVLPKFFIVIGIKVVC